MAGLNGTRDAANAEGGTMKHKSHRLRIASQTRRARQRPRRLSAWRKSARPEDLDQELVHAHDVLAQQHRCSNR